MSGNTTGNTRSFIEAEQYDNFIYTVLHDGLLPTSLYRNVTSFGSGETLNIKTVGARTVQDVEEDVPLIYKPIETGEVQLQITDYKGDALYITDKLRQDGAQIDQLLASSAFETTRAIQENFETRFLNTANAGQTAGDPNIINGQAHRKAGSGTNQTLSENDLVDMKLAFDKANVPQMGRIAIVDPVVAATLNKLVTITSNINGSALSANPTNQMLREMGFDKDHQFVTDWYGWSIWTSNRLPVLAAGTSIDGTEVAPAEGSIVNLFMCVADDNCKPVMNAWRQMPRTESERNKDLQRDEFVTTARYGFGIARVDTLGAIATSATKSA